MAAKYERDYDAPNGYHYGVSANHNEDEVDDVFGQEDGHDVRAERATWLTSG